MPPDRQPEVQETICQFGPLDCDPMGGEAVRCDMCGKRACDFHGDYPDFAAYEAGDWRCPNHLPEEAER